MPIYEYTCGKCKHDFEHFARNLSDQPKKCPKCGSKRVKKQFSSFATTKTFQLASGPSKSSKAPVAKSSEKTSSEKSSSEKSSSEKSSSEKTSNEKTSSEKSSSKKSTSKKSSAGKSSSGSK